jgi:plasmid rolling circle replication initiator protein Rep
MRISWIIFLVSFVLESRRAKQRNSNTAHRLKGTIKQMNETFRRIVAKYRKRSQRNIDCSLKGLKTIECNFNPTSNTYNPHFHIIVSRRINRTMLNRRVVKKLAFQPGDGGGAEP